MLDVIVVGAGPAGNIAALRLASRGYRVSVFDWRHNIGDKLCTGIIGTECSERFPPEPSHVYHEATGATIISPAGKRYRIERTDAPALIVDRVAYVDSIARRAMEAGADYRQGPRVADIDISPSGATVSMAGPGGMYRERAQVVILACGFGSRLLRSVGLLNGRRRDYLVGAQADVLVDGLEETEVYLGERIAPGSFGWLVPLSGSRALVGLISRQRLNGHVGRFLATLQTDGKVKQVIRKPRQWGIPLKPLRRTYGDRVIAVGDAAGLVKPTTGGGIYYALLSGEVAAEAVDEAFVRGDFSAGQLKNYQKRWKALFGREVTVGYYARTLYEALGDQRIEVLLSAFSSCGVQEELINSGEFSFDWHSKIILKALRHRRLGSLIRSFGPVATPFLSQLSGVRFW